MNGANALIATLVANNVDACFANPGTSEMQFVAALDAQPSMRPILCLFEGVATGAADGFARIAGRPACTLLHLGPGLGNGIANLHNARRAGTPIVNVIGDHATHHRKYDAPLNSDVAAIAAPHSVWVKSAETSADVAKLAAEAIAASYGPPGGPASLILPADAAWLPAKTEIVLAQLPEPAAPAVESVADVASALRDAASPVILLGGKSCGVEALAQAARLAAIGIKIYADTFLARQARGAGVFAPNKMPYFGEMALAELASVDLMVMVGTKAPVAFFAYPDTPGELVPEGCARMTLASPAQDPIAALTMLGDALGAPPTGPAQSLILPDVAPTGQLDSYKVGLSIARNLPEGAIICDDGVTSSMGVMVGTANARQHDVLGLTGGAIGIGLPLAIGAAVAAPDRKVVAINGDGAAMYNIQSLWTLAREELDVTAIVFDNASYRILNVEMTRMGANQVGPSARKLLSLDDPAIDWVAMAKGLGVAAVRCETAEQFEMAFKRSMREPGPHLIQAVVK